MGLIIVGAIVLVGGCGLAFRDLSPFRDGRKSLRGKAIMVLGTLLIILGLILAGYQAFLNQPPVC